MAQELVMGKNVVVFTYDPSISVWVPYACYRSCTLSIDSEMIETSITGNGPYRTFTYGAKTFTGAVEGLLELEKANHYGGADMIVKQMTNEVLLMRFEYESRKGDVFIFEASFLFTNNSITSSFDNVSTDSVSLQGSGIPALIYTPTPIIQGIMYREEFVLLAGNTEVTVPEIDGVTIENIIGVGLDGYDYPNIIAAGTPIGTEVRYTPAGAVLKFPYGDIENDRNGFIQYQIIYEGS